MSLLWIFRHRGQQVLAGVVGLGLALAQPGQAAERVYVNYSVFEQSISVESLENYARTGEITDELKNYSRFLTPEQLEQLREGLLVSADIDVVTVSQFLYTPQGEAMLDWLGEVVQTAGRQNGARALRGAVIQAAADPDGGLNALNVLKYFPTRGVRLDLREGLGIAQSAITQINQTRSVTAQIQAQAAETENPIGPLPSLTAPGNAAWQKRVYDALALPTDLYLPEGQQLPLVVLSHGLGGNRETLAYLAEHLASYGFAVAVVEHPGSSAAQLDALLSGQADEAVEPEEMVQRPTSIQTLLDQLSAEGDLGQIDFQNVGVLGQSFGGYTSLALAGATIDTDSLAQSCPPQIVQLNLSLLLQCLVTDLPQPLPALGDERVKAAIAINPLNSTVFGPTGMADISVPLMMIAGSDDTVTPALAEQIRPFTWLTTPERYLLLLENGTHFSAIYNPEASEAVALPPEIIGPRPDLAQRYVKAMSVAFFKLHLSSESQYSPYLTSTYANTLSQSALPLALVDNFEIEE
ncbi:MAG: alpha/beta hydrolase [Cyanobacteria bacterium J06628_6]